MITGLWVAPFLAAMEKTGNVSAAARIAGIDRQTAYEHRSRHPEFREQWDEAVDVAVEVLELEARRRALNGVERPVYYKGTRVDDGKVREYSNDLMMFLLRAHRPEKYRDNVKHEVTGKDGAPLIPAIESSTVTHALGILASLGFRRPDASSDGQPDDSLLSPSADGSSGGVPAAG